MSFDRQFSTIVLRGKISNLRLHRRKQDFVLSEAQHSYAEATAAAGVALGMGACAMGLLQMSANSSEEADWVEFDLDNLPVMGWVWKMPMREGDTVEAVVERRPEGDTLLIPFAVTTVSLLSIRMRRAVRPLYIAEL